jgi:hypothetical protein
MLTGLSPAPAARSSGVQRTSWLVTRWGSPPHPLASRTTPCPHRSADHSAGMVWAARVSLATTPRILSFPQGTEMSQFPRFPHTALCVQAGVPRLNRGGLLHSGTLGSSRGSHSPRCFAASPRPSSALQAKASTTRPSIRAAGPIPGYPPQPRQIAVYGMENEEWRNVGPLPEPILHSAFSMLHSVDASSLAIGRHAGHCKATVIVRADRANTPLACQSSGLVGLPRDEPTTDSGPHGHAPAVRSS